MKKIAGFIWSRVFKFYVFDYITFFLATLFVVKGWRPILVEADDFSKTALLSIGAFCISIIFSITHCALIRRGIKYKLIRDRHKKFSDDTLSNLSVVSPFSIAIAFGIAISFTEMINVNGLFWLPAVYSINRSVFMIGQYIALALYFLLYTNDRPSVALDSDLLYEEET